MAVLQRTYLDEWLNLAALRELLGAHRPRHLARVALNAGSNDEGVRVLLVTLLVRLNHDNLRR